MITKIEGAKEKEMLFSVEGIENDFENFKVLRLEEKTIQLNEDQFHKAIRFIGKKI